MFAALLPRFPILRNNGSWSGVVEPSPVGSTVCLTAALTFDLANRQFCRPGSGERPLPPIFL